ncbi:MAG: TIGR02452 family protein [Muribaculaceae bacterium]|nr:TIGR02452 family protein [Muribaculaceae bacterium]
MYNREYTPERIIELKSNEIFVFGSNLAGSHGGGAASLAYNRFGAVWGQGVGLQGQSYAIPTMQGGVETIKPYVDQFIEFASSHPELKFFVTRIGCGIAGFKIEEIAPLFENAIDIPNVILPKDFVEVMQRQINDTNQNVHTWDSEKDFLKEYRVLMEKVKRGVPNAYSLVKKLRIKEFRNTIDIVNQGYYVTESGVEYRFPSDADMTRNTVFYKDEVHLADSPKNDEPTIVEVRNIDCLYAGVELKEQGYNPAVLNMASRGNPGGGVISGDGAQEETLFRRTNLFRSLYQFAPYAAQYHLTRSRHQYPLDWNFGGIYTPDAIYFRESEKKGYALLENPVSLSFIAVAGLKDPGLTADGMIADHLVGSVKNKIRTIFRIGLLHGHDALVLGALGCGAFRNPPRHVALLFHEVMDEPEFKNRYRKIVFAILDDHNAHRSHNPEGNFKPFAEEFAGMDKPQPSPDVIEALMMWKMGAGDSEKRFNGEDPMPSKKEVATKDSWDNMPMPDMHVIIPMDETITSEAMRIVERGHIPHGMGDHWFMYCEDNTIRYYRSWSGICIYVAKYEDDGTECRITELMVNRDPDQYGSTDNDHDKALFMALLTEEYGGDARGYWKQVHCN